MRMARRAAAVSAVIVGLALAAVVARAAVGALTPAGCLSSGAVSGCTDLGNTSLKAAFGVAVSPDGVTVYVTGLTGNAVNVFTRSASGALTPAGCLSSGTVTGCTDLGNTSLKGATGVAVSPDGKTVYVTGGIGNAVNVFTRSASGALTPAGCLSSGAVTGCTDLGNTSLDGATGVAVSTDGKTVYVTAAAGNAVNVFGREAAAGGGNSSGGGSSGGGSSSGGTSGGGATDTTPPQFTAHLRMDRKRFRVRGAATTRRHATAAGSGFAFALSEAATVTIRIQRPLPGRRVGGACRSVTHANRSNTRCTRFQSLGSLSRAEPSGASHIAFSGRVGGHPLSPGPFRATATAADAAGNVSGASVAGFTIVAH